IPLFVKAGAIIPKSPIMPYIGALKNAPIILEMFPSDKMNQFELYEDDGETNNYKKDDFSVTKIESQKTENRLTVVISAPQQQNFKTEERNFLLKIHVSDSPKNVEVNGNKIMLSATNKVSDNSNTVFNQASYFYDKDNHVLNIRIPDTKSRIEIISSN